MRVKWSSAAVQDLEEVRSYIAEDNPSAALGAAKRISAAINQLREYPNMGRPGKVEGTRELPISGLPYIVPYRVKNDRIEILRVLHAARQWPKNL